MLFRHDIDDAVGLEELPNGMMKNVNKNEERRQGIEVEVKSMPIFNTSLIAGFSYVDAEDRLTGEKLPDIGKYTYDIGVVFDKDPLMASLWGHYIDWRYIDPIDNSRYDCFIWDLYITRRFSLRNDMVLDTFLTIYNVFNGSQYLFDVFKNPERWAEAGLRFRF